MELFYLKGGKMNWNKINKLRTHNKNETKKHFMVKAMTFKLLVDKGYYVYSECEVVNPKTREKRVADIFAENPRKKKERKICVEVETKPSKLKNKKLMNFYEDDILYIIDTREISNDIQDMEFEIKHILGF